MHLFHVGREEVLSWPMDVFVSAVPFDEMKGKSGGAATGKVVPGVNPFEQAARRQDALRAGGM